MTAVMVDDAVQHADSTAGPQCYRCGGPCLTYKGSVHGWTCRGCLARDVDDQIERLDQRNEKFKRESQQLGRGGDIRLAAGRGVTVPPGAGVAP